jgi:hypothetical protein
LRAIKQTLKTTIWSSRTLRLDPFGHPNSCDREYYFAIQIMFHTPVCRIKTKICCRHSFAAPIFVTGLLSRFGS